MVNKNLKRTKKAAKGMIIKMTKLFDIVLFQYFMNTAVVPSFGKTCVFDP